MGRRFPPPLFGVDDLRARSRCFVDVVGDADAALSKDAVVKRARDRLRKDDGSRYSETYLRRVIGSYAQIGVLRQVDGGLSVYQFAQDWRSGDIDFETFLWYAVKRAWAVEGAFPEGITGLYHIHQVLKRADAPLSTTTVKTRLADRYDYEFNEEGIRGYLPLLSGMGALAETEEGYETVDPVRFSERFRNADLLWQFEQWFKREGANTAPPPDLVKRDLAKYYMYRESGGHGRHRSLLDTARREYLSETVLSDSSTPRLDRADTYVKRDRRRQSLREEICERFQGISPQGLAGLSTETLDRMAEASTQTAAERIQAGSGSGFSRTRLEALADTGRAPYTFPEDFELYDWQQEAVDAWFEDSQTAPERGIAQVVTGAGKTVMALEALGRWLDEHPEGVVTVVVPTKVLLHQWLQELTETAGVPASDIGWLGAGQKDGFEDGYRVLVSIVNSAVKDDRLATSLERADATDHLLVADECHRYTGDTFSNIFEYDRTAALGLSATPLSEPGSEERSPEDELLVSELGDIFYSLSYDDGLARDLIPEFRINYVGFELTAAERTAYDRLTEAVGDAVKEIEQRYQHRLYELDGGFARKLQAIKKTADGPTPAITDYFEYTQERRELVADAVSRQAITLELLGETVAADKKAIVFQERIEQLERMVAPFETRGRDSRTGEVVDTDVDRAQLYEQYPALKRIDQRLEDLFFQADYRPVMYHSGHRSDAWNDFAIEWFGEDGFANVMLSVKALVEGVDVPSAEVGIVRVSSGSVRQRIQTLGRVLRTGENPNQRSELYVLYARDTVDADIFERYDWRDELSRADVRHLTWETAEDTVEGEIRPANEEEIPDPPTEQTIPDPSDLEQGDPYEGPRRGFQFSVDADGNPFRDTTDGRRFIENDDYQTVAEFVHKRKDGGSVTVNDANHAVTYLGNHLVFVGVVTDPEDIEYSEASGGVTGPSNISIDDF